MWGWLWNGSAAEVEGFGRASVVRRITMDVDHALDRSCRCAFPCEEARNLLEDLARDSASTVLTLDGRVLVGS